MIGRSNTMERIKIKVLISNLFLFSCHYEHHDKLFFVFSLLFCFLLFRQFQLFPSSLFLFWFVLYDNGRHDDGRYGDIRLPDLLILQYDRHKHDDHNHHRNHCRHGDVDVHGVHGNHGDRDGVYGDGDGHRILWFGCTYLKLL